MCKNVLLHTEIADGKFLFETSITVFGIKQISYSLTEVNHEIQQDFRELFDDLSKCQSYNGLDLAEFKAAPVKNPFQELLNKTAKYDRMQVVQYKYTLGWRDTNLRRQFKRRRDARSHLCIELGQLLEELRTRIFNNILIALDLDFIS